MKTLTVVSVHSSKVMKDFIAFPKKLYANCQQFVPDLDADVRNMFNPKRNSGLSFSEVEGFVAYRNDEPVGRVVAIINRHANEKWNTKAVRFSFLDFIDDDEVSAILLHTVEQWGKSRGMNKVEGPLGITDYDKEGMLISDFDMMGSMVTYYNYPYYPAHMERLGYQKAVDWLSIRIKVPKETPAKYARVAKLAPEMFDVHTRILTKKEIRNGYIYKVFDLLNASFAPLFGFSAFTNDQAKEFMNIYLPLLKTEMIPVVENSKGELISIAVTIGSLSHALRKTKGKLFPFGWYHLLKALKWKNEDTVELLLIAVRPDMQGLGITAMLFDRLVEAYNKEGFEWAETGPQLEDNFKELSLWNALKPRYVKRRRCFQKDI